MAKILFEVDGGSQVGGHFEIHSWELMRAHACAFELASFPGLLLVEVVEGLV